MHHRKTTLAGCVHYPLHLWLSIFKRGWADYDRHPASWDDLCSVPFVGLNLFLLSLRDTDLHASEHEIERMISSYPSQRLEGFKARVRNIARRARADSDLASIDAIVNQLPEGKKSFLTQTPTIRAKVVEIADIQRRLNQIDRPFIRQLYAENLVAKIDAFRSQIEGFHEPLASEFRSAAEAWLEQAREQSKKATRIVEREPAPQVFRAGDPVNRSQEAFVARLGVVGQIERQIALANGCPGLLIYGRRRMGKSTLIRNLDAFVPETILIATLSMQHPNAFSSLAHFVRLINEQMRAALGHETRTVENADLPGLFQLLADVDTELDQTGRRLVLAIDEFEAIDQKIGEGVFPQDLLATIRESIQTHRRLIWTFAGSHSITELKNAPWTSYLVSTLTIEVPPFSENETRLLLTDPLKESPLYANRDRHRPRFDTGFWGEGGIEWIHAQTAGWPHLLQLLASTAVDLANESGLSSLDRTALEEAAKRSVSLGDTVLRQLVHGESQTECEKIYIAAFRAADRQPPPDDDVVLQSLRHRQIIVEDGGAWRLKVPLMQQWLSARG